MDTPEPCLTKEGRSRCHQAEPLRKLCFARFADPVANGKALAICGAGRDGKNPVKDKVKWVADYRFLRLRLTQP